MECACGFSCGTADAFLRHVESERLKVFNTDEEGAVGMSTHELVECGGLPTRPPPRKGSVAANMVKRQDRARNLVIPFTCDACVFSCGTMAAWIRHQERKHGAAPSTCTPCENDDKSAMQHASPEQLVLKKKGNEYMTHHDNTTQGAGDVSVVVGPVAASASNTHTSSPAWMACSEQTLSTRIQKGIDVSFAEVDEYDHEENNNISSPSSPNVVWSAQLIRGTSQHSKRKSGKTMSRLARPSNPLEERFNVNDEMEKAIEFPVR